MTVWIALFRGINVGGNNIVPMKELRTLLEGIGFSGVQTYIQSGNAVFSSSETSAEKIRTLILKSVEEKFGFTTKIMMLQRDELEAAVSANPFPEGEADPKMLHLFFLGARPENTDLAVFDQWKKDSESIALIGDVFYLHAREGIGRSKTAERAERLLAVSATARNWRSSCKILELAQSV
ncbi:MAG: hypothetical protein COB37_10475 [Kordiimonadales bacterium]|nr:MAG: hypothetical protein COB37_10475 [Kordiimonadales bacterium]